jgi:hypothetical protein
MYQTITSIWQATASLTKLSIPKLIFVSFLAARLTSLPKGTEWIVAELWRRKCGAFVDRGKVMEAMAQQLPMASILFSRLFFYFRNRQTKDHD